MKPLITIRDRARSGPLPAQDAEAIARAALALADPDRLASFTIIANSDGDITARMLAEHQGCSTDAADTHLADLRRDGLVTSDGRGHRVNAYTVERLIALLRN